MADIWSGLAYLLAELIEKHASEINLDGETQLSRINKKRKKYRILL